MQSITEAELTARTRVLVRCDLDVPLKNGKPEETFRLDKSLPTLQYIQEKGAFPIICGHMGRPSGVYKEELSTKQLKPYFDEHLGANNYTLLENLRFDPGEDNNSLTYAKSLAVHAEVYVNESFATSHRFSASMVTLPEILPPFAGLHLLKEVETAATLLKDPKRPLVVIIGGAKLETKKPVINKFAKFADAVLIGGKLAFDWNEEVTQNLKLPIDYAPGNKDIGPKTIELFVNVVKSASTVLMVGPLGLYEDPKFITGTKRVIEAMAKSECFSILGGGDTIAAADKIGYLDKMGFVSTGGGALLQFLVDGSLPALESLGYHG